VFPFRGRWLKPAWSEIELRPRSACDRSKRMGLQADMYPHRREVLPKDRFHLAQNDRGQAMAGLRWRLGQKARREGSRSWRLPGLGLGSAPDWAWPGGRSGVRGKGLVDRRGWLRRRFGRRRFFATSRRTNAEPPRPSEFIGKACLNHPSAKVAWVTSQRRSIHRGTSHPSKLIG